MSTRYTLLLDSGYRCASRDLKKKWLESCHSGSEEAGYDDICARDTYIIRPNLHRNLQVIQIVNFCIEAIYSHAHRDRQNCLKPPSQIAKLLDTPQL